MQTHVDVVVVVVVDVVVVIVVVIVAVVVIVVVGNGQLISKSLKGELGSYSLSMVIMYGGTILKYNILHDIAKALVEARTSSTSAVDKGAEG